MTQEDPLAILSLYGLDKVLTDADDPRLWAAAVTVAWPRPDDPELKKGLYHDVPRFSFGIGQIAEHTGSRSRGSPGLRATEYWMLERVDAGHFRSIQGEAAYPHFILDISRPSAETDSAQVHIGDNPAPLVGRGVTSVWKRQPDGSWTDTGEIVSQWIS